MNPGDVDRARDNVRRALELRGRTSFEVSMELSRNRTYLDDFLRGRKQSLSAAFLQNLANNLSINREILDGSQCWSDDPSILLATSPISHEGLRAEMEWNAATSRVSAIMENLARVTGDQERRGLEELRAAQAEQASAFSRMMDAEKRILGDRRSETSPGLGDANSIVNYLNQFTNATGSISIRKIFDNSLKRGSDEGIGAGDLIFIDSDRLDYMSGGIFVIEEAGSVYVRRVEYLRNKPNPTIKCSSNSPDFPDFEVQISQVKILGRVVAQMRTI